MSLDVSLITKTPITKKGTGVFVRENGQNRELTIEEVKEKFPNATIEEYEFETECVFEGNITHNLTEMADAAGIYEACWKPQAIGATKAGDIISILEKGLEDMKTRPDYFKKFNSENGWGTYEDFISWVETYLDACRQYPNTVIEVSR